MTDQEMLDNLKQIQAEAQDALKKDNKAALDKALADYDGKFEEYEKQLNRIEASVRTAELGLSGGADQKDAAARKAFNTFIRSGEVMDVMVAGNDSQGGYLVPEVQATEILKLATDGNPMRELATVKTISGDSYPFLVRGGKAGASWVGETAARPNTDTPTYSERRITPFEIYANPPVSQTLLEDEAFDVETELNEAIAEEFSAQENAKFFTGSGTGEVQGLLSGATVDDASWVDGKIGVLTAASSTAVAGDELIDLQDALKDRYQANATWLMNKKTFTALRKLKQGASGADRYLLWTPEIIGGRLVNTLMGAPVRKCSAMPAPAADALAVVYGDIRAGYVIVDRIGMTMMRDPYSYKPYVQFYTRKRVGGGIRNYEAFKALKMKGA
jgi:HK97 family phage major capsid protein|nr:MAG TPA: major capsid protein [Caudoviricetes sp.]